MDNDTTDPTPVSVQLESVGYRPPRLRITATYDTAGTHWPTSIDVEIHDDEALEEAVIISSVKEIVAVLTQTGSATTPATWASGISVSGSAAVRNGGAA